MSRKRCHRKVRVPMLPRGLRPKLDRAQLRDLALSHHATVDAVCHGQATELHLWQLVGAAMTWSKVADMLGVGCEEMNAQLEMAVRVVERYGRTGRVGFSGTEYQVAKLGLQVMDELAEIVDLPTAVIASEWAEAKVNALEQATRPHQGADTREVAA